MDNVVNIICLISAVNASLISLIVLFLNKKDTPQKEDTTTAVITSENVESTLSMLNLCKSMVTLEVSRIITSYKRLGAPYNMLKFDQDVTDISMKVREAFKTNVELNNDSMLNTMYIWQFIMDEATTQLMVESALWNNQLMLN